MFVIRLALIVLLLVPGLCLAADDVITINSGVCGIVSAGGAHTISDISSCSYDNNEAGDGLDQDNDDIVVAGGTLRCLDDATQDGTTGVGITVQSGATFDCQVANHDTAPAAITVTVGPKGLDCQAGSTCLFKGGFRDLTDGSIDAEPDADEPWFVGDVIPCPTQTSNTSGGADDFWEPDCSSNASEVMFAYPDWKYDPGNESQQGGDDTTIDTAFATISTTAGHEDVAYFLTPNGGAEASGEEYFFYEVVDADSNDALLDNIIELNIRQSDRDQDVSGDACDAGPQNTGNNTAGYELAERDVAQGTISTDPVTKGTRTFRVASTVGTERTLVNCVASGIDYENVGGDYVGRWVRFMSEQGDDVCGDADDEPCIPEAVPYRIMRFEFDYLGGAGTDNRFTIGDIRGFRSNKAASESYTIGYGFATGDPFLLIAPLRITSATAATDDGDVNLNGATTLVGVVLDAMSNFNSGNSFTTDDIRYVWFRDTAAGRDLWDIDLAAQDISMSYVSNTPADDDQTDTSTRRNDHFMILHSTQDPTIRLTGFSFRYYEDDQIANDRTPSPSFTIIADGVRCQFSSNGGDSLGCFDMQGEEGAKLYVSNVEFVDAGESEALNDYTDAENVMLWAQRASFIDEYVNPVRNLTIIGGEGWNIGAFIKFAADGFVVRDHYMVDDDAQGNTWNLFYAANGYFQDVVAAKDTLIGGVGTSTVPGTVDNVAIIDPQTFDVGGSGCDSQFGTDCAVLELSDLTGSVDRSVNRLSVVFTDDWEAKSFTLRSGGSPGALTASAGNDGAVGFQTYASGSVDDDADTSLAFSNSLFYGIRGRDCQETAQEGCIFASWDLATNDVDTDGYSTPADKGIIYSGDMCFGGMRRGPINNATIPDTAIAPRFNNDPTDEIRAEADLRRGVGPGWANGRPGGQAKVYLSNGTIVGAGSCGVSSERPPGVLTKSKVHSMSRVEPESLLAGSQAAVGDCPAPGCPDP